MGEAADTDPVEVAREIALRRLDQRAHTRAELRAVLLARGTPEAVAEAVLGRLAGVGLVDDAAFAASWAQSRHGVRHLSRRAVAGELRAKGVDRGLIEDATNAIDDDSELAAARALAETRRRALTGLPSAVAYRRLAGTLGRKGYGPGVVGRVVRESLAEWGADAGDLPPGHDEP